MMRDMMMVSPDSVSRSLASPAETPYIDVSHGVCVCVCVCERVACVLRVCVCACVRVARAGT